MLSVTKVFRWCSLNLENFWFYIWVVVLWLNFTTQMTLRHLLLMPMNKILDCKDHQIYSKMLRKICIYVKRKSNISFRVIKNSSFDQRFLMIKTFLKIICQIIFRKVLTIRKLRCSEWETRNRHQRLLVKISCLPLRTCVCYQCNFIVYDTKY